ncbi:MAG: S-methyl-5-thioribose-1-phosphate isomerase, partial [Rhodospirillales bacterium]|nr:S-methyl-5-thioribose-1-phosphate isomerase [Rhodospirillales bacterium]
MRVGGVPYRTLWMAEDGRALNIIDQTRLPHAFTVASLRTLADFERAIRDMWVRGAPLIGATAAYGIALAMRADASNAALAEGCARLLATRPTAVNLRWALDEMAA